MLNQENLTVRRIAWGLLCLNFLLYLLNKNAIDSKFYADLFLYIGILCMLIPIGSKEEKLVRSWNWYMTLAGVIGFVMSVVMRLV